MKINEVIVESEQLDELSAMDIARGVGSAVGKTAQGVGAVAGGLKGAWDAGKAGYQQGVSFTGGQRIGRSNPRAAAPSASSAAGGNLDSMADQDLEAMKSKIDSVLAARKGSPQAAGGAAPQQSGTPAAGSNASPQGQPSAAPQGQPAAGGPIPNQEKLVQSISALTPGQIAEIRKALRTVVKNQKKVAEGIGDTIKAGWNKLTGRGNISFENIMKAISQMSAADANNLLKKLPAAPKPAAAPTASGAGLPGLSAPTLQPKPTGNVTATGAPSTSGSITAGGVSRPGAPVAPKAAAPAPTAAPKAAATSPYGELTADQQKYVAAREKEGLSQDQIKTALARGAGGKGQRAPLTRPAQLNTIGGVPGFKPDSVMSQADPKSFAAGQQKKAELDAKSAERVAAAKAKRAPAQPTNEGFYSKFLGKQI
jgi:hypothetical protein